MLRHRRRALPRVRGRAERAWGHAEPARGHALLHEPEELRGGVHRRRGGGILRPRRHAERGPRRDASRHRRARWRGLRDVRGGANALGAAGAEGVAAVPGAGAENAPPGPPTEGGFMAARTSAAPDARPFFPEHARTCQGAKRFLSSGPKVAQTSRALDARASRLAHPARSSFPETSVPVVRSARRARRAGRVARARGRRAWTRASQRFAAHARKRAGLLNPRINRRTFAGRDEFRADRARDRGGWGGARFWPREKSRA